MPSESEVFGAVTSSTAASSGGVTGSTDGRTRRSLGDVTGSTRGGATSSFGGAVVSGGTANNGVGGARPSGGNSPSAGGVGVGGISAASGAATSTSLDLNQGLVAHLKFDETQGTVAVNSADATKNATYAGNCTHPSGRIDGAVQLRNSDKLSPDWIVLPSGLLRGISAATIAVWLLDLSPTRDGGHLFDFATSSTDEFYFSPVDSNPSTTAQGCHLAGTSNGSVFVDLWTSTPITNGLSGKWQHVAVSWSATSIGLYVDGVSVRTQSNPGVLPSHFGDATTNWLGRTLSDAYYALYAEFDDFRIYNRALTAPEIARLHQLR